MELTVCLRFTNNLVKIVSSEQLIALPLTPLAGCSSHQAAYSKLTGSPSQLCQLATHSPITSET
uniref:Uncharacterized protein n=1 Tax=Anguilla anguilla TaxID=7936 RepID=A0A0E9T4N4_ANGAN